MAGPIFFFFSSFFHSVMFQFMEETYSTEVYFVLGRTKNLEDAQSYIIEEYTEFEDLIQFDLVDVYSNLTLKTLATFQWFAAACDSDLMLKVDGDVFLFPDELDTWLTIMRST